MSEKRKKVVLSIQEKLELIKNIEKGMSKKHISLQYGVGESTVRDIFKQKDKLMKFASTSDNCSSMKKRKTMKTSTYEELDAALLQWISQVRIEGISISGPIVATKAKQFFKMLGLEGKFDASSGWLTRFKQRHGIREIGIHSDISSCYKQVAEDFKTEFEQFLQKEEISYEQLYSADESGLFWKCLPTRVLAFESGQQVPGHKNIKKRLTIMACVNATGSQKLKLVVIGKSKKLRSFKGTRAENLPVHYFNQKKGCMDQKIFKEWFEKKFISQVREHLKSQNLPQKAVLLIDNAPSHPIGLKSEDGHFFVKFLPPSITALIQPMDQGVIASMKKNYRTSLLKKIIEEGNDLRVFWKDYTILDSIYDINTAWRSVKQSTLVESWRKILPSMENTLIEYTEKEVEVSALDLTNFAKSITGGENVDTDNIDEWMNCDANDPGFERLTDEQIVGRALSTVSESEEKNDETQCVLNQVSHEEALKHIGGLIQYLEEQDDTTLCDKTLLKKLQLQVKKKCFQTKKQQLVTDFSVTK